MACGHPSRGGESEKQPAPRWMLTEVATGLQRLVLLALPGTPAMEAIEGTARAWADALWYAPKAWDRDLDAPRIAAAFRRMAHRLERFPTPKALLDAMPARPPQPALPKPKISQAQRRGNRRRIARMMTEAIERNQAQPRPPRAFGHPSGGGENDLTPAQEEALLAEVRERYKNVPKAESA